jgi:putative DNA primase/helicase
MINDYSIDDALDRRALADEPTDDDIEIGRLARLSPIEYERDRKAAAEQMGVRTTILDRLVRVERDNIDGDSAKQGRALSLPEPQPWHEPIDGGELLRDLSATIRRHVVMPDHVADAVAMWVVHTYIVDCFGISPRLAITSPEKSCGKTTLLDVLSRWYGGRSRPRTRPPPRSSAWWRCCGQLY